MKLNWKYYGDGEWLASSSVRDDLYSVRKTDGGWELRYIAGCLSGRARTTVITRTKLRREAMHLAYRDYIGELDLVVK